MSRRSFVVVALVMAACNADPPAPSSKPVAVRPVIAWPTPQSVDTKAIALLEDEDAKLVARSPVPVLVPATRVEGAKLMVEAEYYAFSGKLPNGVTLAIQGTRKAYRYDNVKPVKGDRTLRGTDGFVTMNEGIRQATWSEHGAAYSVDVECADHKDERCAKEDFVIELTNRLAYIGGSGR